MPIAKLFWTGRSQAVRLPEEFRMPGENVRISRQGSAVLLEPESAQPEPPEPTKSAIADSWAWYDAIKGKFSDDFSPRGAEPQPPCPPDPDLVQAFDKLGEALEKATAKAAGKTPPK